MNLLDLKIPKHTRNYEAFKSLGLINEQYNPKKDYLVELTQANIDLALTKAQSKSSKQKELQKL